MRGLVLAGPRRIEVRDDLPDPVVQAPGDAVVRVVLAGLCGSDLHPWAGREPFLPGVVPGHEAVGDVVAVGEDVAHVGVGDRVVVPFTTSCGRCPPCSAGLSARCVDGRLLGWGDPDGTRPPLHGTQAELVRVPHADGTLVPLPPGVDTATGVLLADNLPTGWYAAQRADVAAGEPAVVLGCGAVGLCTVLALQALGAAPVVASDPVGARRDRAAELGARTTTPADLAALVARLTDDRGVAGVVDAAGTAGSERAGLAALRPGGTLQVVAVPTRPRLEITPSEAYDRNLTVRHGRAPVRSLIDEVVAALLDGRVGGGVRDLVEVPALALEDGPQAYERAATPQGGAGKLLFAPHG